MKKILQIIVLLSVFFLSPVASYAVLQIDENGNPIDKVTSPDEMVIMNAPDEIRDGDQPTSNDLAIPSVSATDDEIVTDANGDADYANQEADLANQEDNILPKILLYSGIGLVLIVLGVYFFVRKRK